MSPVPTIPTSKNLLTQTLSMSIPDTKKYGYVLSEDQQNAACFQGLLSGNINTLVTSQYVPDVTGFSWSNPSVIKGLPGSQKNTQGYYYYRDTTSLPSAPSVSTL